MIIICWKHLRNSTMYIHSYLMVDNVQTKQININKYISDVYPCILRYYTVPKTNSQTLRMMVSRKDFQFKFPQCSHTIQWLVGAFERYADMLVNMGSSSPIFEVNIKTYDLGDIMWHHSTSARDRHDILGSQSDASPFCPTWLVQCWNPIVIFWPTKSNL